MSTALRLPPALLDLTLVSARLHLHNAQHVGARLLRGIPTGKRHAHQGAMLAPRPDPSPYFVPPPEVDQSFYSGRPRRRSRQEEGGARADAVRQRPPTELEHRVQALEVAAEQEAAFDPPVYSESDLLAIYEDLLAAPSQSVPVVNTDAIDVVQQEQEDTAHMQEVALRLLERVEVGSSDPLIVYRPLVAHLQEVAEQLKNVRIAAGFISSSESERAGSLGAVPQHIPTGMLTQNQWAALVRTSLRAHDSSSAEIVIDLMKRSGMPAAEESLNDVLAYYAKAGDIANAERFLQHVIRDTPTERQRDLHVKAHIKGIAPRTFPTSALAVLHAYEERGVPVPLRTYTRAIVALLRTRKGVGPAHAWDLFAHMRYVVHPIPDAALYTLMISACADPRAAEPERALDLFTEMTVDQGLPPTARTYSAAAIACARSGHKKYVHEAFRLAKEMLDAHRDARGHGAFRPDNRMFLALLEGAKRIGDLARARWILAEMVRESAQEGSEVVVNDLAMMHVFHAYSAYKPPFHRKMAVLVDEQALNGSPAASPTEQSDSSDQADAAHTVHSGSTTEATKTSSDVGPTNGDEEISGPGFAHLPPQTHPALIAEARALFERIVRESNPGAETASSQTPAGPAPFQHVGRTSHLLNAYLAVHYSHAPFDTWAALYRTLYDELDIRRDAHSYVAVLERCVLSRGDEAQRAARFAQEVWAEWSRVEAAWRAGEDDAVAKNVDARMVERAHVAMIRMLAIANKLHTALEHVRAFADAYPPAHLRAAAPKPALRSSRTVLLHAARPLVRLTSALDVPDDAVPPLLTFADVDVLHQRLVGARDAFGIRYLNGLCRTYEGLLRRRRDAALRAEPLPEETQSALGVEDAGAQSSRTFLSPACP